MNKKTIRVVVDQEYGPEEWWETARDQADAGKLPSPRLAPLLQPGGPSEIIVSPAVAERIRAWARRLPGWAAGPPHARHPLLFLLSG